MILSPDVTGVLGVGGACFFVAAGAWDSTRTPCFVSMDSIGCPQSQSLSCTIISTATWVTPSIETDERIRVAGPFPASASAATTGAARDEEENATSTIIANER